MPLPTFEHEISELLPTYDLVCRKCFTLTTTYKFLAIPDRICERCGGFLKGYNSISNIVIASIIKDLVEIVRKVGKRGKQTYLFICHACNTTMKLDIGENLNHLVGCLKYQRIGGIVKRLREGGLV